MIPKKQSRRGLKDCNARIDGSNCRNVRIDKILNMDKSSCFLEPFLYRFSCKTEKDSLLLSYTKMGSNNNDIPDGLPVIDKYVQIAINKLHLLK